jgi:hypothetical protein
LLVVIFLFKAANDDIDALLAELDAPAPKKSKESKQKKAEEKVRTSTSWSMQAHLS